MPCTPTAFLWPGLPATAPHLSSSLGLGIALWTQSEEGQVHEADVTAAKRHQAQEIAATWMDWACHGEPERTQRMGLYQDKHRSLSEGGRTGNQEFPPALPNVSPRKAGTLRPGISSCSVFFGIIPMWLQLKGRWSVGKDAENQRGVGWGTMRIFQCQASRFIPRARRNQGGCGQGEDSLDFGGGQMEGRGPD